MLHTSVRLNGSESNTPWTTRWITYVPSAAWFCVGALAAHLAAVISWTVLVLCRCKAVCLQYCRTNVWGESSHKAQPARAKRHSPGLGSTHGTLETNQSCASENLKKAHRHRRWGSRSSAISTTWSSTYPRSGSEHTHTKTHTHDPSILLYQYGNHTICYGPADKNSPGLRSSLAHVRPLCLSLIFNILVEVWIPIKAC